MARKVINVVYKVDDKELVKAKSTIQGVEKETKDAEKEMVKFDKATQKAGRDGHASMSKFNSIINLISFAAITAGVVALGKQVINITSEFQKFQAVLTNTLGSRSAANAAMKQIQEFAAKTPFSVQELTAAFVKLANQGFKPTSEEMRKLGDLASSTGKQFDQLTEAIIDAQTGEFERLKEFGIRAQKEGDKVTFTFKEVKTQVDFTASSIRDYVLALGDAVGVSGSMAAISETLGGKISNLGDAYDQLLINLGNQNSGVIFQSLAFLAGMIDVLNVSMSDPIADKAIKNAQTYRDALEAAFKTNNPEAINKAILENVAATNEWAESAKELREETEKATTWEEILRLNAVQQVEAKTVELLKELTQEYINKAKNLVPVITVVKKETEKLTEADTENILPDNAFAEDAFWVQYRDQVDKGVNDVYDTWKAGNDAIEQENIQSWDEELQARSQALKDRIKLEEQAAERSKQLAFQLGQELLSNLLLENTISTDSIQEKYDREIELAGDNERAKKEIKLREKEELKKIEEENKQIQRRNAIRSILIDTAVSIIKTFSQFGFPAGVLPAALMAATGAAAAANVRKYKDGGINIDGAGTSTSDSIPAMLSKGESVINAQATSKSMNLLEAINDRKIDDSILYKLSTGGGRQANFDDSGIIKAIERNKVDYITQGYSLYQATQVGKNFKRTIRSKVQGY